MNLRSVMTRTLNDEYETEQLVPIYSKHDGRRKDVAPSQEQIEHLDDQLPAAASLRMKMATLEAIVDDIIEDSIEHSVENGEEPNSTKIEEEVEPVIAAAESLHLVAKFPRRRVRELISTHLRYPGDPWVELASKAAHFAAGAMTDVKEEDLVAGEVQSDGSTTPGNIHEDTDAGMDEDELVDTPPEEDRISEEVVKAEPGSPMESTVEVDPVIPAPAAAAMRYLAASAINHRKATAIMSHRLTGRMLVDMVHELRYRLPKSFLQKYSYFVD